MVHKYKNTVRIPVIDFFRPKNHFQPITNERMSLEKESFIVASSLSVSLSHFSFVSTCVNPGEHCRVTRPPLAFASGTRVQRRRPLQEGGVSVFMNRRSLPSRWGGRLFSSFRYGRIEGPCVLSARVGSPSPGGKGAPFYLFIGGSSAGSWLRHGASSLVVARGFRTRSLEGLQGFGGTIVVLSDVGSFLFAPKPADSHGGAQRTWSSAWTIWYHQFRLVLEDCRCSDRDPAGHVSGNSSCP